ncbi:hypothetical protein WICPIJ_002607 [Wickerhamomyces pijperi]|uniref:Mitochondrial inner membrane i-AAA protease complex subunit MGR1 n=1 Tax=Wickerhamomyces pijperi TaxID=599730 RepID=A0A9P8Q9A9_WICPI|nr:hypothetical protein WICPIJ_002607 [Wickerhamomyces pijperi]
MGLYIPGGSSGSGANNATSTPPPSSDSDSSSSTSASTSGSALTINGRTYYPRPSLGLSAWGLLKPSPDNWMAVSTLLSIQTIIGLSFIRNVRLNWRYTGTWNKIFHGGLGVWLCYQTGLGVSKMVLPWDPWIEEARMSRMKLQEKNWTQWWFGDWEYKFSTVEEWEKKVGHWITITEEIEQEYAKICGEFQKVSFKIRELEKVRDSKILEELNLLGDDWKIAKLPQYREKSQFLSTSNLIQGKAVPVVPEELDQFIQDEDSLILDEIRELNSPWDALKEDTEYVIRFVPRFRWLQERTEFTQSRMAEHASQESQLKSPAETEGGTETETV